MERRSFIAALFGGAAAAPVVAQQALAPATKNVVATLAMDTAPLMQGFTELRSVVGRARPFNYAEGSRTYVYRTGIPAIDALRSVSGVYKELMERRLDR